MANVITIGRIVCSAALLLCAAFSPGFYAWYCLAGLTDVLDGAVARKTNTASEFGARLDTAADMVFVAACLIKLLPALEMPVWLWVWIGGIAALKAANVVWGCVRQGRFPAEHTTLNRVTGAALFALPLILPAVEIEYCGGAVCVMATIAAVQEGRVIRGRGRRA